MRRCAQFSQVAHDHEKNQLTVFYYIMNIVYSLPPFIIQLFILPEIFKVGRYSYSPSTPLPCQ